MSNFLSPVGRLVQGGFEPQTKDQKGRPLTVKTGPNAGQPTQRYFIAVAFPKLTRNTQTQQMEVNPEFWQFVNEIYAVAKAGYGQFFQAAGKADDFPFLYGALPAPSHPKFTFKIMDGDGIDDNGKPNASKDGFAGHWVVKFSSSFPPKCYRHGQYGPGQQLDKPEEVIKRGYYVSVGGTCEPNIGSDVPGVYLNHNLVELCFVGDEIVGGPDAAAVFGGRTLVMPEGAKSIPVGAPVAPAPAPGGTPAPAPLPTPAAAAPTPAPSPLAAHAPAPAPVTPNHNFVNAAGAPPVPPAPAAAPAPPAAFPPAGWVVHPQSPGWYWNQATNEVIDEATLRSRG